MQAGDGITEITNKQQAYTEEYWWTTPVPADVVLGTVPVSDKLEDAFANKVQEWHERHKEAWETGQGIDDYDEDKEDDEDEDQDPDNIDN